MLVLGVEAPCMRLHQCHLTLSELPLRLMKLDFLITQHLVEVEGMLGVGGVHAHLAVVFLTSSLGLRPFNIKVGADFDKGFLRDRGLLPHSEELLPPGQLLLPPEELLL
jgi:hypothetical protein